MCFYDFDSGDCITPPPHPPPPTPAWYLKFHTWYKVEISTRNTTHEMMTINDVIEWVMWLIYNLQNRK